MEWELTRTEKACSGECETFLIRDLVVLLRTMQYRVYLAPGQSKEGCKNFTLDIYLTRFGDFNDLYLGRQSFQQLSLSDGCYYQLSDYPAFGKLDSQSNPLNAYLNELALWFT